MLTIRPGAHNDVANVVRSGGPGTLLYAPKGPGNDGGHKKKGRLRYHKRPQSREETPKEGSNSAVGFGGRYRIQLAKTIAINSSIAHRDHGPIRRFMALALKAEYFRNGSNGPVRNVCFWAAAPPARLHSTRRQSDNRCARDRRPLRRRVILCSSGMISSRPSCRAAISFVVRECRSAGD